MPDRNSSVLRRRIIQALVGLALSEISGLNKTIGLRPHHLQGFSENQHFESDLLPSSFRVFDRLSSTPHADERIAGQDGLDHVGLRVKP